MGDSEDMFGQAEPQKGVGVPEPSPAELEAAGQTALFGGPAPEAPASPQKPSEAEPPALAKTATAQSHAQPYRVLARKYRPQTFSQLIGQEPMVRTLANAIRRDRLAHAFLMTGVRGVGKTSTARLIAKALNCIGPDGQGGPTIDPCGVCEQCRAIAEGRHIDVIEMDAASHTGVDDVREIIEAVRYAAVSARYKIYIIDEVHMLSRNAFNALLKTLEEPPPHVKFLFATTEVEKLPVTVLSRTQRFDLRRIPGELLAQHYANICHIEGVGIEDEALVLIAGAAEGSVRDGLSILDQAIAFADMERDAADGDHRPQVSAERVRAMLGLADSQARRALFASLLEGEPAALIETVERQYALGVEPAALIRAAMDLAHRIALAQVSRGELAAPTPEERDAIVDWAARLGAGQVHRVWQMLLRGYDEVRIAPDPLAAAQMALLRVLHAADLPDPGELAKRLARIEAGETMPAARAEDRGSSEPPRSQDSAMDWRALVERIDADGSMHLASKLRMQVRVIELAPGRLVYGLEEGFTEDLCPALRTALRKVTDRRWQVERGEGEGRPTLAAEDEAARAAQAQEIREHDLVEAAFAAFPDAEMLDQDTDRPAVRSWNARQ